MAVFDRRVKVFGCIKILKPCQLSQIGLIQSVSPFIFCYHQNMEKKIHLEKILWDECDKITKLKVKKDQKSFVAPNADSLIDAYFAITEEGIKVYSFGIYYGKKAVGFIMIAYDCPWATKYYGLPEKYYYIWRFMVDKKYQGQGLGKILLGCSR